MKSISSTGLAALLLLCAAALPSQAVVRGTPVHALALYGEPKYGPDFTHFEYVNPNAPKGGAFVKTNEAYLTFDTFNPYTVKGAPVHGLELLLYDTLMTPSQDEPASVYGLIAQSVEIAPDNAWVEFVLRPEARFTDGSAITAEDVAFSFETVMTKAWPRYRSMYANVQDVQAASKSVVRFTFKTTNDRNLPLLLARYLPILSKSYWENRDFTDTTLEIPVTNGPYVIESFEVGKNIVYRRWNEYWGADLPVNKGQYNFDTVRFEYFRDDDVQFESFKTNGYDFVREVRARRWATGYDFPAVTNGLVKKFEVKSIEPVSVQPLYLNLRNEQFQDKRVRQAISYAFDFESLNANLFYGQYVRSRSYWQGSPLEAVGLPSAAELQLLEPFRGQVPTEVFTTEFSHPVNKGDGDIRESLLLARDLLQDAGWELRDGVLVNIESGKPFTFEILTRSPSSEAVFLPFTQNLKRLGITATLRMVDTSQYINRINDFDYDAANLVFPRNDLTPGNEQYENWGAQAADIKGSNNLSGVKDPVVDALISKIIEAENYEDVTAATRALDRVLTWNFYQILTYTSPTERYAYWTKLGMPEVMPALGIGRMGEFSDGLGESVIALWWFDEANAADMGNEQQAQLDTSNDDEARNSGMNTFVWAIVAAGVLVIAIIGVRRRRVRK